jgi:hypothetical protein
MTERKKIILLSLLVPWIALAGLMISLHLHGAPFRAVVVLFALVMTALFVYVISHMIKLKKRRPR